MPSGIRDPPVTRNTSSLLLRVRGNEANRRAVPTLDWGNISPRKAAPRDIRVSKLRLAPGNQRLGPQSMSRVYTPATMTGPIRVVVSPRVDSPLRDMIDLIPASMVNIAPERKDELVAAMQGASLVIEAEPKWVAHYEPSTKEIHLSVRVLELFWCAAYAYVVLFDEKYATRDPMDRTQTDLTKPESVANAMKLLRWAFQDWVDGNGTPIPKELIPQRLPRLLGSHASVADELCLCAVGFILHHELAHHRFQHTPGEAAAILEQEKQADQEAAAWILDGVDPQSLFFTKRMAGASVATLAMTARGIHTKRHGGGAHPRHFDRLFNFLDRYAADQPNHSAWIFATVALKLHLDNSNVSTPTTEFDSFRDCMSSYIDAIADACV